MEKEVQGAGGMFAVSGAGGTAAHLMAWCRAARAPTRKLTMLPCGEGISLGICSLFYGI